MFALADTPTIPEPAVVVLGRGDFHVMDNEIFQCTGENRRRTTSKMEAGRIWSGDPRMQQSLERQSLQVTARHLFRQVLQVKRTQIVGCIGFAARRVLT